MTTALALLISAMQLLTMVQNSPNVSEDFRVYANEVANQAIVVAKEEMVKAQATTTTVQVPATPTVINNYYTVPTPTADTPTGNTNVAELITSQPVELLVSTDSRVLGGGCGIANVSARVRYSDGTIKDGEGVSLSYEKGSTKMQKGYGFSFSPTKSQTLSFSYNNLSKDLALEVTQPNFPLSSLELQTDGTYIIKATGNLYNPVTHQCN